PIMTEGWMEDYGLGDEISDELFGQRSPRPLPIESDEWLQELLEEISYTYTPAEIPFHAYQEQTPRKPSPPDLVWALFTILPDSQSNRIRTFRHTRRAKADNSPYINFIEKEPELRAQLND